MLSDTPRLITNCGFHLFVPSVYSPFKQILELTYRMASCFVCSGLSMSTMLFLRSHCPVLIARFFLIANAFNCLKESTPGALYRRARASHLFTSFPSKLSCLAEAVAPVAILLVN